MLVVGFQFMTTVLVSSCCDGAEDAVVMTNSHVTQPNISLKVFDFMLRLADIPFQEHFWLNSLLIQLTKNLCGKNKFQYDLNLIKIPSFVIILRNSSTEICLAADPCVDC